MFWLLLKYDKQLTVLNIFLVPRIGFYNFEVSFFFKKKKDASNPLVKEKISVYRFGIYSTDTLVNYGCQWSLFRFHCLLHPKQKVQKPLAMKELLRLGASPTSLFGKDMK